MNEPTWRRIEAALDERRDPFAEPALARALAADPGAQRAARRLVERLALVARAPAPRAARRSRRRGLVLAAAAVLVLAFVLREHAGRASRPPGRPAEECTARVTIHVERATPPPARGAAVPLESRRIVRWTLEGAAP